MQGLYAEFNGLLNDTTRGLRDAKLSKHKIIFEMVIFGPNMKNGQKSNVSYSNSTNTQRIEMKLEILIESRTAVRMRPVSLFGMQ